MIKKDLLKKQDAITTLTLIIILIVAIIVIGVVFYFLFFSDNVQNTTKVNAIKPEIILEYEEESGASEVKVKIFAETQDKKGIKQIILPDGNTVEDSEYEYTIKENGRYTFEVVGNNNESTTKEIKISNITKLSLSEPYVPDNFTVVEDDVEKGFVIKDKYENEFVWVPVSKGYMERTNQFDTKYSENGSSVTELRNSVSKYCGFYIGRYEASQAIGNRVAIVPNQMPWVNISYIDAENYSNNMSKDYKYEDGLKTMIMCSDAWDTTLQWLDKTNQYYPSSTDFGNYSGEVLETGATETDKVNNIFDMAGNVREWTSEIYVATQNISENDKNKNKNKNSTNEVSIPEDNSTTLGKINRVVRGGGATLARPPEARNTNQEGQTSAEWGFRVILFKTE